MTEETRGAAGRPGASLAVDHGAAERDETADAPAFGAARYMRFSLSLASIIIDDFEFFPPPSKESWQRRAFLALFRLYLYPLIALTLIVFEPLSGARAMVQYSVGGALLVVGFGLAFWITFRMGWRNAFGEKRGLVTTGWFRWSRNPIYVVTWIGLVGWALIANDGRVTILLLLWAAMYMAAPLLEEPWLEREYGDDYSAYKARTPRFVRGRRTCLRIVNQSVFMIVFDVTKFPAAAAKADSNRLEIPVHADPSAAARIGPDRVAARTVRLGERLAVDGL